MRVNTLCVEFFATANVGDSLTVDADMAPSIYVWANRRGAKVSMRRIGGQPNTRLVSVVTLPTKRPPVPYEKFAALIAKCNELQEELHEAKKELKLMKEHYE